MKRYGFSLLPSQEEEFQNLLDKSMRSRSLRQYITQDYSLPENLDELSHPVDGVKPVPLYLDDVTNERLNELVEIAKKSGALRVNRSSLMRNILDNLIKDVKAGHEFAEERETKGINLYLESGTMDLLQEFIPFRDRNAAIELFIMKDYKLTDNLAKLRAKPVNTEQKYVALGKEAIELLDGYVSKLGDKDISRMSILRDVIEKIVEKFSKQSFQTLVADRQLYRAMQSYEQVYSRDALRESVESYFKGNGDMDKSKSD